MALLRPKTTSIVTQGSAAQGGVKSIASQASVARRQEIYTPGPAPSSQDLARLQQHVIEATGAVNSLPIMGGVYYPNVAFTAGLGLVFQHGIVDTTAAFLIARVRTVGLYPQVFEVAQVRPVAGVTVLESFSACTCDVWFYPQPSAQGSKPAVAGTSVPVPPTTPVVPVAPGVGGWITAFDIDFTTLPNQVLTSDGPNTINGLVWTKGNSANELTPATITNGTGLQWNCKHSGGFFYEGVVRSTPYLWLPLTTLLSGVPYDGTTGLRIFASVVNDNETAARDQTYFGLDSNSTAYTIMFARGADNLYSGPFTSFLEQSTTQVSKLGASVGAIGSTTQTFCCVIDSLLPRSLSILYTGAIAAGAAFPALSSFQPHLVNVLASNVIWTSTGKKVSDLGLFLGCGHNGSSGAYTPIVQRVRVDYRL